MPFRSTVIEAKLLLIVWLLKSLYSGVKLSLIWRSLKGVLVVTSCYRKRTINTLLSGWEPFILNGKDGETNRMYNSYNSVIKRQTDFSNGQGIWIAISPKKIQVSPAFQKFVLATSLSRKTCVMSTCFCPENSEEDFCFHGKKGKKRKEHSVCVLRRAVTEAARSPSGGRGASKLLWRDLCSLCQHQAACSFERCLWASVLSSTYFVRPSARCALRYQKGLKELFFGV